MIKLYLRYHLFDLEFQSQEFFSEVFNLLIFINFRVKQTHCKTFLKCTSGCNLPNSFDSGNHHHRLVHSVCAYKYEEKQTQAESTYPSHFFIHSQMGLYFPFHLLLSRNNVLAPVLYQNLKICSVLFQVQQRDFVTDLTCPPVRGCIHQCQFSQTLPQCSCKQCKSV